jgi:hypothetical protein
LKTLMRLTLSLLILNGCAKRQPLRFQEDLSSSTLTCSPNSDAELLPTDLRRLSKRELSHSLKDILGVSIFSAVASSLSVLPGESTNLIFDTQNSSVDFVHVETLFSLAEAVATEIVDRNPTFLSLATCFAGTAVTQRPCFQKFISDLGYRVFRKPLNSDLMAMYMSAYDSLSTETRQDTAKVLIASMFQSPHFYYLLEIEGAARDPGEQVLELTPHELATRLSYNYTGSTPDAALLNEARLNRLSTDEQILFQVRRLSTNPEGRAHLKEYLSQSLHLDGLSTMGYTPTFLGGLTTTGLETQMKNEVLDFFDYQIFQTTGTYQDLMTSQISFVKNPQLAAIYKISPSTDPTGKIVFSDPKRRGLLTRAALLATGTDEGNPFHRGKTIYTDFLCEEIGRPDPETLPDAFAMTPPEGTASTRQRLESLTKSNVCMSCHSSINPLGFAFEEFDAIGRFRTAEVLENKITGTSASYPIDAHTTGTIDSDVHQIAGVSGLSQILADGSAGAECFSRKWYRFARGIKENTAQEACSIKKLAAAAKNPQEGLRGMFEALAQLPQYRVRVKPSN